MSPIAETTTHQVGAVGALAGDPAGDAADPVGVRDRRAAELHDDEGVGHGGRIVARRGGGGGRGVSALAPSPASGPGPARCPASPDRCRTIDVHHEKDRRPELASHVLRPRQPAADRADRRAAPSTPRSWCSRRRRRALRRRCSPGPRRPRGPGSSSCPTSAASTRTTRSWRCASPRPAWTRSRSTTSGGPRGSASGSGRPTSTSWPTWARRGSPACRWDVRAAVERLRAVGPGRGRAIFTIGFCFGGRLAFLAKTLGLDLAGAIGFYGWPVGARGDIPAPADFDRAHDRRPSSRSSAAPTRGSRPRRSRRSRTRSPPPACPTRSSPTRRPALLLRPQGGGLPRKPRPTPGRGCSPSSGRTRPAA